MDKVLENLRNLGQARLIALGAVGLIVLIVVAMIATNISSPRMSALYSGLAPSEAGRVVAAVEQMGISVSVSDDGDTILVPTDKVARVRMGLAEQGLPSSGNLGYELFDDQGSLGMTSFMQQVNRLRALEGELARTIQTIEGVEAARVHLVLPERQAFARDEAPPTASVVVRTDNVNQLQRSQANAVRHLVAAAVPKLDAGQVTVLDSRGNVLFSEDTGPTAASQQASSLRAEKELQIVRAVEAMLSPRLGLGNVRVQATVELDLDREVVREEVFDPAQTAVRSTQALEEVTDSTETLPDAATTVEQNLPEADVNGGPAPGSRTQTERAEEVTNYEVSSTVRERISEPGAVDRISVAVLVNGTYQSDVEGNAVYQPRDPEELARIENLVKSAIGFDSARGDVVTVENLEFVDVVRDLPSAAAPGIGEILSNNLMTLIQWGVLLTISILLIAFAIRPIMASLMPAAPEDRDADPFGAAAGALAGQTAAEEQGGMIMGPDGQPIPLQLEGPDGALAGGEGYGGTAGGAPMDEALDNMLEVRAVEGKVRSSSVRKLGQIVDQYPDEAIAILRSWIYEKAA